MLHRGGMHFWNRRQLRPTARGVPDWPAAGRRPRRSQGASGMFLVQRQVYLGNRCSPIMSRKESAPQLQPFALGNVRPGQGHCRPAELEYRELEMPIGFRHPLRQSDVRFIPHASRPAPACRLYPATGRGASAAGLHTGVRGRPVWPVGRSCPRQCRPHARHRRRLRSPQ